MTKRQAMEAARVLYGRMFSVKKLLGKALCDDCPTCDGTVKDAIRRINIALNRVTKIVKPKSTGKD